MAANITTSTLVNLVTKGYEKIFNENWDRLPRQYLEISKEIQMDNKTWVSHGITGFSAMGTKTEGSAPTQDDSTSQYTITLTAVAYGAYWKITKEMIDDDQYGKIRELPKLAAIAANESREVAVANVLNRAFNGSYTGYDSVELCSLLHPKVSGTQQNELTNPATLEKQSLRDMILLMRQFVDQKEIPVSKKPMKLVVPNELMFDAEELVMSPRDSETDTNAVTPKVQAGLKVVINDRLTDADAFFVMAEPEEIYFAKRFDISTEINPQVDASRTIMYDTFQRFATGWSNYRDIVGSPGTA